MRIAIFLMICSLSSWRLRLIAQRACQAEASHPKRRKGREKGEKENSINKITQKEIDAIEYDDVVEDTGFITPLAADLDRLDDDSKKAAG